MKRPILQIVPHPDAPADGVTEQARTLADEIRAAHHIDSDLLRIARADAASLADQLSARASPGTLIVHYVNYGYARRGCPVWLVAGLGRWKASHAENRLLVVFHELYAFGPPWRSSFWLSPLQRALAKRLASLADAAVTSLPRYGATLAGWGLPADKLTVRAVFSNVGETAQPAPLSARRRRLAVFGNAGVRARLYRRGGAMLAAWARQLGIEEIVDIGAHSADSNLAGLRIRPTGLLGAAQVSALLQDCYAGAVAYPPGYLGKSTIFAAYCAHGLLPLVCSGGRRGEEEVRPGEHYLLMDPGSPAATAESAQAVASKAHHWYMTHNVAQAGGWLAARLACGTNEPYPDCTRTS